MGIGEVPRDWRHKRVAVRAEVGGWFLDVEADESRAILESELVATLAALGLRELDIPAVMGHDRRVTRAISYWAWNAEGDDGSPAYTGIRYLSRLNTRWECWAVFSDRAPINQLEVREITLDMPELRSVAERYHLHLF